MANPKRHHYLPEFYLAGFSRSDLVWVFDREREECKRLTPKNTAVIGHYYSVEDEHGEKHPDVEIQLAKKVDGPAGRIIGKLERGESIDEAEKRALSLFVGYMKSRVPVFEQWHNDIVSADQKNLLRMAFADPAHARASLARLECFTGEPACASPEEMVDFVARDEYSIDVPRNSSIETMCAVAEEVAHLASRMNWFILHAPARKSFITTDSPFSLFPPPSDRWPSAFPVGIGTPGSVKYLPLTQTIALAIGDAGNALMHEQASDSVIREINLAVAQHAVLVIGRDEALVRSVVRAMGRRCP
ncbi:DUF4238 domain-containing protein [Candidatus Sumerlaeota bacterium]|nr:DUF4238 domain-containing protein [Candidatus Sumerlaeota bacterium]